MLREEKRTGIFAELYSELNAMDSFSYESSTSERGAQHQCWRKGFGLASHHFRSDAFVSVLAWEFSCLEAAILLGMFEQSVNTDCLHFL